MGETARVEGVRIGIFLPNLRGGGAERMMVNLANGFLDVGASVDLVLASAEGEYLPEVARGVRIVDLAVGRVGRSVPALRRYLREARPAALLSTLYRANIAALLAKRMAGGGVRVFIREANSLRHDRPANSREWLVRRIAPLVYPSADGIIAVSRGVAEDLARATGIERSKITVIPNPVVTPDLLERARAPVDHPWYRAGARVVLGVGRLSRQKDFATLIRAVAIVRQRMDVKLLILGNGPEYDALDRLRRSLGLTEHVCLHPFVANPFAFMARSAVFALSSAWEGLPGVLIQAMACGCPVVSTDCPHGPAEILENGRYGPLVPVGDVEGLARALMEVLDSPPPRELLQGRAMEFSVERSCRMYLQTMLS